MESGFEKYDFDITIFANFCTIFGIVGSGMFLTIAASGGLLWRGRCTVNGLLAREECAGGLGGDIGGSRNLVLMHIGGFAACVLVILPAGLILRRIAYRGGTALVFVRKHRNSIFSALMIHMVLCMQYCRCLADLRRSQSGGSGAAHVRLELQYDSHGLLPRRVCVDARPWETALITSVALTNEDWGCEGRYNSAQACFTMMCWFSFRAWMPVSWGSAAATAVVMWLVVLGAALPAGMYGEALARQLVLLALVAALSLHVASERRKDSFRTYLSWQTLLDISQRTGAFLATLLPRGVLERAEMHDRRLELQADVEDVLCLFCCLPPMETLGRSPSLPPPLPPSLPPSLPTSLPPFLPPPLPPFPPPSLPPSLCQSLSLHRYI